MLGTNNNPVNKEEISLFELNGRIKEKINQSFADAYWVRAEMSDVRANVSGHCYLEFIEKSAAGQTIAKARGAIWAKTFRIINPYFEQETGQPFASGLKVLVKVTVEFHELYGYSLNVCDIDPAYTVGDMLRRRMEIIRRLQQEGVFNLNKELELPVLPARIAVITSPTAAGYEDFINQLNGNKNGYPFYLKLFPAIMQGEKTEASVIASLDRIYQHIDCFDVVVIIRGGGATSDLTSFDSYLLAANCAQFPLPIITGIGHERDDTVLDLVAHTRMKTPTAVAEFLIGQMDLAAGEVSLLQQAVVSSSLNRMERRRSQLHMLVGKLPVTVTNLINKHNTLLTDSKNRLKQSVTKKVMDANQYMQLTEQYITMVSPEYIMKRGYSLTLKDGKIMKRVTSFKTGDELSTRFVDGEIKSKVICRIIKKPIRKP
ncbi:MAG: exodeoxyribonuclease VII large subunit [Tannerellaceae bacterium]|jgi:exodeoxyribonuclease VII large subunit|nr:exodeoxyribonuclease VII large subunit [Tannerellaceae bacterium]